MQQLGREASPSACDTSHTLRSALTHNAIYKTICVCGRVCLLYVGPPQTMCHPTFSVRLSGQMETTAREFDAKKQHHGRKHPVPKTILKPDELSTKCNETVRYSSSQFRLVPYNVADS